MKKLKLHQGVYQMGIMLLVCVGNMLLNPLLGDQCAAAVYEVGPGRAYARIVDVPTHNLSAGDIVRVYYKSTPYYEKFLLHGTGTEAAPILLQGIPDGNGNKPIIDGANAVSNEAYGDHYWNEDRQVILVGQYSNRFAQHVIIDGFVVRNANRGNSFTCDTGGTVTYATNAAGIRVSYGTQITVRNCEIYSNENGIFSSNTGDFTIEHSYVHDNGAGNSSSSQEHNLYLCGGSGSVVTVQFSRFGDMLNDGQQCKFRAETLIFRYNWVEGGKNSQLDLVEDGSNGTADVYAYGNVIIKPSPTNNGRMIHFGGDNSSVARRGTLYFFNNTCIYNGSRTGYLFNISEPGANVVAENNIFLNNTTQSVYLWGGNQNISGNKNWLSRSISNANVFSNSLTGTVPGFTDLANDDYTLTSGSPCVNVVSGFSPPAGHTLNFQYVKHLGSENRPSSGALDLGAFEYGSANSYLLWTQ